MILNGQLLKPWIAEGLTIGDRSMRRHNRPQQSCLAATVWRQDESPLAEAPIVVAEIEPLAAAKDPHVLDL